LNLKRKAILLRNCEYQTSLLKEKQHRKSSRQWLESKSQTKILPDKFSKPKIEKYLALNFFKPNESRTKGKQLSKDIRSYFI